METELVIDRMKLHQLLRQHRTWSTKRLAEELGRSQSWVKKWRKRFRESPEKNWKMFQSRSRAPHHRPKKLHEQVRTVILALRDQLPEKYGRKVGAKTILYHLHQDKQLQEAGYWLPRSTHTIWRVLTAAGRIAQKPTRILYPVERPEPLEEWEMDFGMISLGSEKWLEFLLAIDRGSSILVGVEPAERFNAESALLAIAKLLLTQGMPARIRFDRDTRFVASWTTDGYPSALIRFLNCLGIEAVICPPRRPDLKPFVERGVRTVKHEKLYVDRPTNIEQAEQQLQDFRYFYNHERANQAVSCHNQPPAQAFPQLPTLSAVPQEIDPDAWLTKHHGRIFKRRVSATGSVMIDKYTYFMGRTYAGQRISIHLNATDRTLLALHQGNKIKGIPLQGLYNGKMKFQDYLQSMLEEARSIERHLQLKAVAVKQLA